MQNKEQKGIIFNVQRFSVHDGAGIRTVAFLKGCPLRCRWCSNPESQLHAPERAFNPNRCLGAAVCGYCVDACKTGSITLTEEGFIKYARSHCNNCGNCVRRCPSGAQLFYGEELTVAEIIKRIEKDDIFFARSGGGLTLSGGEPMAQPEFSLALLREAKKNRIHTTMETCGHCKPELMEQACRCLDSLIFDVKCLDAKKHKQFTGSDNEQILENLQNISTNFPNLPILVRTPVIPGFNDSEDEIMEIRRSLPHKPQIHYEVLTFHRFGQPKYAYIGRPWTMESAVADEAFMKHLREKLAEFKI